MDKMQIKSIADLDEVKRIQELEYENYKYRVLVCGGMGCISAKCGEVEAALTNAIVTAGLDSDVDVTITGCMGTCDIGPVMLVLPDNTFYTELNPEKVQEIVQSHLGNGQIVEKYTYFDKALGTNVPNLDDINFFKDQVKIALRNCGAINFNSVEEYVARDGYKAIGKILTEGVTPAQVVEEVKKSGLRGRGGGGFPTGIKWEAGLNAPEGQKYIICNADEGDPGAFMNRAILEGDNHTLIEGMIIGGYAIGADQGYIYVRAEYGLAIERLSVAIEEAKAFGLLGDNLFGTDFSFNLELRMGAGAYVCGEETSLMASIEGQRGEPRQKPPFPFQSGLFEKPSIINNVETLATIPPILLNGADWYTQYGTPGNAGTKVFALAGNIENTGVIEIPLGMKVEDVIYKIGGGGLNGKEIKAVQLGGPAGGCVPKNLLDTVIEYDALAAIGSIMGSGGMVVMSEDNCMVDTARYFVEFLTEESCGKCLPCRVGTVRMLEILERITEGKGTVEDLDLIKELSAAIKDTALCGLGQASPNVVLSTLRHFEDEYLDHINNKNCAAGVCTEMSTGGSK